MPRIILLKCPACEGEISFAPSEARDVACPACGKSVPVRPDETLLQSGIVQTCAACGHDTLYIQKDFNRTLGLVIVVTGVIASVVFFSRDLPLYAMAALVVTALVDLLIYSLVGEVTVCYACHAIYRGFRKNPQHGAFDLKNLEKYGGRDPRF